MSDIEQQDREVQALTTHRPPRSNAGQSADPICKGNRRACNCWAGNCIRNAN